MIRHGNLDLLHHTKCIEKVNQRRKVCYQVDELMKDMVVMSNDDEREDINVKNILLVNYIIRYGTKR